MKKLLFTFFAAGMLLTAAYSYNPPAGGEDLNMLGSPSNLSGANSVKHDSFLYIAILYIESV